MLQVIQNQNANTTVIYSSMVACPDLVADTKEVVGDVTSASSSPTTDMSKDNVVPEPMRNRKWRLSAWRICGRIN